MKKKSYSPEEKIQNKKGKKRNNKKKYENISTNLKKSLFPFFGRLLKTFFLPFKEISFQPEISSPALFRIQGRYRERCRAEQTVENLCV